LAAYPDQDLAPCAPCARGPGPCGGNDRSMRPATKLGLTEVERFEEYGAEHWFGVWPSVTPSG